MNAVASPFPVSHSCLPPWDRAPRHSDRDPLGLWAMPRQPPVAPGPVNHLRFQATPRLGPELARESLRLLRLRVLQAQATASGRRSWQGTKLTSQPGLPPARVHPLAPKCQSRLPEPRIPVPILAKQAPRPAAPATALPGHRRSPTALQGKRAPPEKVSSTAVCGSGRPMISRLSASPGTSMPRTKECPRRKCRLDCRLDAVLDRPHRLACPR